MRPDGRGNDRVDWAVGRDTSADRRDSKTRCPSLPYRRCRSSRGTHRVRAPVGESWRWCGRGEDLISILEAIQGFGWMKWSVVGFLRGKEEAWKRHPNLGSVKGRLTLDRTGRSGLPVWDERDGGLVSTKSQTSRRDGSFQLSIDFYYSKTFLRNRDS